MTIAQALKASFVDDGLTPLEHYLKFNYEERYVALCKRVDVEPVSFAKWLCRDVKSI